MLASTSLWSGAREGWELTGAVGGGQGGVAVGVANRRGSMVTRMKNGHWEKERPGEVALNGSTAASTPTFALLIVSSASCVLVTGAPGGVSGTTTSGVSFSADGDSASWSSVMACLALRVRTRAEMSSGMWMHSVPSREASGRTPRKKI